MSERERERESSIYMYKNNVGVIYSHSTKKKNCFISFMNILPFNPSVCPGDDF